MAFRGVLFHSSYFTAKSSVCNQEDRTEAAQLNTDSVKQIIVNKMAMKKKEGSDWSEVDVSSNNFFRYISKAIFLNPMLQILFSVFIVEKVQGGDEEHVSEFLLSAA